MGLEKVTHDRRVHRSRGRHEKSATITLRIVGSVSDPWGKLPPSRWFLFIDGECCASGTESISIDELFDVLGLPEGFAFDAQLPNPPEALQWML